MGHKFTYYLPYIFIDDDGDTLKYTSSVTLCKSQVTHTYDLPTTYVSWLYYDTVRNLLTGEPDSKSIAYTETDDEYKYYYQEFNITIYVTDPYSYYTSTNFFLIVQNSPPKRIGDPL